MISKILGHFQEFCRKNWWVFVVFAISLVFIFFTNTGDILEITLVFLVYFLAELCIMIMVSYMHEKNYKASSMFQFIGNIIFTILFMYHYISSAQVHYFLASPIYISSAIRNIFLYHFNIHLRWINAVNVFFLWILSFWSYYIYNLWEFTLQIFLQSLGMIIFTSYLVMSDAKEHAKYFFGLVWIGLIVIWSVYGVFYEYWLGKIYWVTIAFVLMPLTLLLVYLKNIRKYL